MAMGFGMTAISKTLYVVGLAVLFWELVILPLAMIHHYHPEMLQMMSVPQ